MAVLAGQKNVAATGTPEPLAGSTTSVSVTVQAKSTNTRSVFVGNATNQFVELPPGASVALNVTNLNQVFIKVQVNGQGVNYLGVS
jgi:hypothetical protein